MNLRDGKTAKANSLILSFSIGGSVGEYRRGAGEGSSHPAYVTE